MTDQAASVLALIDANLSAAILDEDRTRDDVAEAYVARLRVGVFDGWDEFNRAIVKRWSISGLTYVKDRAWGLLRDDPKITDPIDRSAAERGVHLPGDPGREILVHLNVTAPVSNRMTADEIADAILDAIHSDVRLKSLWIVCPLAESLDGSS